MGLNRNINDDSTLAYLFNKTRQGASDALGKAVEKINDALTAINNTIASIQTALDNKVSKTGNETVAGVKTFSDSPKFNTDVIIKSSDRYKDIILRQNDSTNGNCGMIRMDAGDATNQTHNRFLFLEYSPQTTAATAHTGFNEGYRLPAPTKGLEASVNYEILTSKSPVTIAQGGTGQTAVTSTSTASQIITAASGFSISEANYYQWGKVAMIRVKFKKTAAQSTAAAMLLGTIVSGKRPITTASATVTDATITHAFIGLGGAINASGTWAANGEKTVVATYILP